MRIYTQTPFRMVPPRGIVVLHDERDDLRAPQPVPPPDEEALKRRLLAAYADEVVRMLGLWVSECEPAVIYSEGVQRGLALAGTMEILVPSRLSTLEACAAAVLG